MSDASESVTSRAEEILVVAQDFIQTRGYNGFSYRDIAAAIGIKSASIHYHYPTKGDLGRSVAARYCDQFGYALQTIAASQKTAKARLEGYSALFRNTLVERDRLCMCGMLAGEVETIPEAVKSEVARFFEEQQRWLTDVLQAGIDQGDISAQQDAQTWATTFLAALEGAMLVSRGLDDSAHFDAVSTKLLETIFL
ncbi:MAG: TetR/AcrR family transcriptional regulator [Cyanobacteria bacterium P01_A01_bin.116]